MFKKSGACHYAQNVTLVVRGDSLEKSMSHYLIEQLRGKSNIAVQLRSEVEAIHGDDHLTSIDIRDNATKTADVMIVADSSSLLEPTRRPIGCQPKSHSIRICMS